MIYHPYDKGQRVPVLLELIIDENIKIQSGTTLRESQDDE